MSTRRRRYFTVDEALAHLLDEEDANFFGEDRESQSHENSDLVEFREGLEFTRAATGVTPTMMTMRTSSTVVSTQRRQRRHSFAMALSRHLTVL